MSTRSPKKSSSSSSSSSTPSSVRWISQAWNEDVEITEICQKLFGNSSQPVDMPKIHGVQRQLRAESKKRDPKGIHKFTHKCSENDGTTFFMVDNPCKKGCPDDTPCRQGSTESCVGEESKGQCPKDSLRCDAATMGKMKLGDLRVFAQCISGADATEPLDTQEFLATPEPARKSSPPSAPESNDKGGGAKTDSANSRESRADRSEETVTDSTPPTVVSQLACAKCAGNTAGPCKHVDTGRCTAYQPNGLCPIAHAPCQPVPCTHVRTPCYDVSSPLKQPRCLPKDPLTCRELDATGTICKTHACPPNHVENREVAWQGAFYHDPTDHTKGLWNMQVASSLTLDEMRALSRGVPGPSSGAFCGDPRGWWQEEGPSRYALP